MTISSDILSFVLITLKKIISIVQNNCKTKLLTILFVSFFIICVQGFAFDNASLQKIIEAIETKNNGTALSATFVRTQYTPQKTGEFSENDQPKILRTSRSELLVNDSGIKESLYDLQATDNSLKQYTYHYSNNGIYSRSYDSKNNYVTARKSSHTISNYHSIALSPYVAVHRNRFISRTIPIFFSRLSSAQVTSEIDVVIKGSNCIIIEGEYENAVPEKYFKITVAPDYNYAIMHLEEYDASKRILNEVKADDFVEVSDLWIAKQSEVIQYKYDDYEGNSVQVSRLEVLEPKAVFVTREDFIINFPRGAKGYNATLDLRMGEDEIVDVLSSSLDEIYNLKEVKNKEIIDYDKKPYETANIIEEKESVPDKKLKQDVTSETINQQVPASNSNNSRIKLIGLLLIIVTCVCCAVYLYRKFKCRKY